MITKITSTATTPVLPPPPPLSSPIELILLQEFWDLESNFDLSSRGCRGGLLQKQERVTSGKLGGSNVGNTQSLIVASGLVSCHPQTYDLPPPATPGRSGWGRCSFTGL